MPAPRRRLASPDGLAAGFEAVRRELEVPVEHPPEALAEARAAAAGSRPPVDGERRDLRDVPFVTLDPAGSTDLDQAMHLERRASGYRVRYAIADTAAFVVPGGALDRAVHERVTTVYCPDTRVPLHPAEISEGAGSLLPGQDRPAVVWSFELAEDGEVADVAVERATVRSRAQLDYAGAQARLDAGVDRDDVLALLVEIGGRRLALERARGGVSLGLPEQEVRRGAGGWELVRRAPLPVEDHNAQLSLMTGMAAATLMTQGGVGVLRTMPAADAEAVASLRATARALGVPWPDGASYGAVLDGLDRTLPSTSAFLDAATSLFRGAAWTPFEGEPPADKVHGAVGAPYAHVTAPLRRLVDRYGLEVSLAVQAGRDVPGWVLEALPRLGEEMAVGTARANAVDRACTDLVEAALLEPLVGTVLEGVALDARTVALTEPAVVARTAERDLPAGERVRVRVAQADVATRTVRLELEG
ncbi:RNB domain-containing ribonuclease [Actinotalea ferrariae]|uniref:RNB domain-containing ribonuclease n=1 Tax=Actinotalea ferrariae TaxID=1386098 RepID=UPI001C8BC073|nr:RNB domain-containing ribonuclease [Actinotalea ferrariae]MBX9245096.1 RNB domain-containing ribonuclease [Actinotalea ferrariae]